MKKKLKVLIVEDSAVFAAYMKKLLTDNGFEVAGIASDPYEARDMILKLDPDLLTLDIEMPRMDGIKFLTRLLPQYPIPCVVVSSLENREKEAIEAGAAGFCHKPDPSEEGKSVRFAMALCASLNMAAKDSRISLRKKSGAADQTAGQKAESRNIEIIALGASTGGTEALIKVINHFPDGLPPVLITQHMPPGFTQMYAERVNKHSPMTVCEAEDKLRLKNGMCVIAAGGKQMRLMKDASGYYITSREGEKVSGHCPSVDVLFDSVADAAGGAVVAALLTGMGADGAAGLLKLRKKGAYTIGQNKETCVVYGMPMEAYKLGAVCEEAPLEEIGSIILRKVGGE
ncbi:MAG: chemotaxis-specific protein-glutamate methyltransferase CheB [Huintestinicola sp.]